VSNGLAVSRLADFGLAVSRLADLDCSPRFSRLLIIMAVILVDGCVVPARRNRGQLL
jgi:hypothetical protein